LVVVGVGDRTEIALQPFGLLEVVADLRPEVGDERRVVLALLALVDPALEPQRREEADRDQDRVDRLVGEELAPRDAALVARICRHIMLLRTAARERPRAIQGPPGGQDDPAMPDRVAE